MFGYKGDKPGRLIDSVRFSADVQTSSGANILDESVRSTKGEERAHDISITLGLIGYHLCLTVGADGNASAS